MKVIAIVGTRRRDTPKDYVAVERAFNRLQTAWPDSKICGLSLVGVQWVGTDLLKLLRRSTGAAHHDFLS